jgi:hypothetical protein
LRLAIPFSDRDPIVFHCCLADRNRRGVSLRHHNP